MQTVKVMDSSMSDYLHDDEIVELKHMNTGKNYQVLVKNEDDSPESNGSVGVYVPISEIDTLLVEGDRLILVLSKDGLPDIASERGKVISDVIQRIRNPN